MNKHFNMCVAAFFLLIYASYGEFNRKQEAEITADNHDLVYNPETEDSPITTENISNLLKELIADSDKKLHEETKKAAELGDSIEQHNLGVDYAEGTRVAKDHGEAVKWLKKAAEQGNERSQYNLGIFYSQGTGVATDHSEAVKWFKKAAEQGNADAQYNLGFSYANGLGVPEDHTEAVKWFKKAAEQGN
ncbi:MAG: tetratricopeptide repeat protein, partial [Akkermansiaceae bacterium]